MGVQGARNGKLYRYSLSQVGVPRGRVEREAYGERRRGSVGGVLDVAVDAGVLRIHSLQAHQFHAYQVRMAYPGRAD